MGQWDKICSIISRVCGAKVHALFSITQLFVRLFVRDNVCSHAESAEFTQRIIISHRKHRKHRNLLFPADNDNLGPAEMAEMAEILITI